MLFYLVSAGIAILFMHKNLVQHLCKVLICYGAYSDKFHQYAKKTWITTSV